MGCFSLFVTVAIYVDVGGWFGVKRGIWTQRF